MDVKPIEDKLNEFINNVMCRRIPNQQKARNLWGELSAYIEPSFKNEFEIEWSHYMLNEWGDESPKMFSVDISKLKDYFYGEVFSEKDRHILRW